MVDEDGKLPCVVQDNMVDVSLSQAIKPSESSFTKEILMMMHGFGDVDSPILQTAEMINEFVYEQICCYLNLASDVAQQRDSNEIGIEDIMFLFRSNVPRLFHFMRHLNFRDSKGSLKSSTAKNEFMFESLDFKRYKRTKVIYDSATMEHAPLPKRQAAYGKMDMDMSNSEFVARVFHLCKEYLGGQWSHMTTDDFKLTPLGGGLTNKLYICSLYSSKHVNGKEDNCFPNKVLLRIYGLILQDFPAQIQESVVFSILAERNIGPRLFGVFSGGRLEEYVPSQTLKTGDLSVPTTSKQIAVRMSEYHRLVMPVKKSPICIMSKLFTYQKKIKGASFTSSKNQPLYERFLEYDVDAEVKYLEDLIMNLDAVVVFCHNDVQEGNLLRHTDTPHESNPIQMIDFEYSGYNYRGFDIGNHFCEWMYDYSHHSWPFFSSKPENFPDEVQQLRFVNSYLESMYNAIPSRRDDEKWSPRVVLSETHRFVLLSHLFWALWSVRQAQISDIQFGYLEYALVRMQAYMEHKKLVE